MERAEGALMLNTRNNADVQIVRSWLQHQEQGTTGEELLHATLDAEEASIRFRKRLEGV